MNTLSHKQKLKELDTIPGIAKFILDDWPEIPRKPKIYLSALLQCPPHTINEGVINIITQFIKYSKDYKNEEAKRKLQDFIT